MEGEGEAGNALESKGVLLAEGERGRGGLWGEEVEVGARGGGGARDDVGTRTRRAGSGEKGKNGRLYRI